MKRAINILVATVFVLGITTSHAGIGKTPQFSWSGTWQDESGGIISVREKDGFLDITGKDKASIYTCTCLVAQNGIVKCLGEGMNHIGNFRFLYQSTLSINSSGSIDETWEAFSATGNLSGKSKFVKVEIKNR